MTTCGQVVQGDAELTADLDCSSEAAGPMLTLSGTLHLNGHTIRGNASLNDLFLTSVVVHCPERCTLIGPGTIREGRIGVSAYENLNLSDVTLEAHAGIGAVASRKMKASAVTAIGNGTGLVATSADVRYSTISGNETGIQCSTNQHTHESGNCRVRESTATANSSIGIDSSWRLLVRGTTVSGGGTGVSAPYLRMKDAVIENCDSDGVLFFRSARIRSSQILNNAGAGIVEEPTLFREMISVRETAVVGNGEHGLWVQTPRVGIRGSNLTGNCVTSADASCVDLASWYVPSFHNSACGTSDNLSSPGTSFGICSLD